MKREKRFLYLSLYLLVAPFLLNCIYVPTPATGDSAVSGRRINVPYTPGADEPPLPPRSIFWFGQVTPTQNYADARLIYNDENLYVTLHIFDRYLWYDNNPTVETLTDWDAATLYLKLDGNSGDAPDEDSYRFVAQLNNNPDRAGYQAAYRGDNGSWVNSAIPFTTRSGWRGEGVNDGAEARGWTATFEIPFASLGLAGRPATGTVWGLGVVVHDRDDAAGAPIADQQWPESMNGQTPSTWGQLRFGIPGYSPPFAIPGGNVVARQGLDGAIVPDGHVGGATNCGDPFNPDFFNGWGDANYAGATQINIQNQADVADWPCFSKYYVTFPLEAVPAGKVIISARLILHQFGNSHPENARRSHIHVFAIAGDWQEETLTWNNAPLAVENVSAAWVDPLLDFPGWPGVPREWNVTRAVAQAYDAAAPLQLALYSSDGAYHSGKYFSSSNVGDWNAVARPTLEIVWGDLVADYVTHYLPLVVGR